MPASLVRCGLMLPDNKHFSIKYVKITIDYITNMNNDIAEEFSCRKIRLKCSRRDSYLYHYQIHKEATLTHELWGDALYCIFVRKSHQNGNFFLTNLPNIPSQKQSFKVEPTSFLKMLFCEWNEWNDVKVIGSVVVKLKTFSTKCSDFLYM